MAINQGGDFYNLRQRQALEEWGRLLKKYPDELREEMTYADFQEAWKLNRDIPLDAWDIYARAHGLDPRTGKKIVDAHKDDWDEWDRKIPTKTPEQEAREKEEAEKAKQELLKTNEDTAPLEVVSQNEVKDQDTAPIPVVGDKPSKSVDVPVSHTEEEGRALTRAELDELRRQFQKNIEVPGQAKGGATLATPVYESPALRPPVVAASRTSARQQDTAAPTGTTSRPHYHPRRNNKTLEKILRRLFKPSLEKLPEQVAQKALLSNPVFWVVGGIILFMLAALIMIISKGNLPDLGRRQDPEVIPVVPGEEDSDVPGIPGMTLVVSAPESVGQGENIPYTITITYDGDLDVLVYDPIPLNAEFVSASPPGGQYDEISKTWSWKLNELTPASESGGARTYLLSITLRPLSNDSYVYNNVFATAAPKTGDGVAPNNDNCNGFYALDNPAGVNFGDPACEYANDEVKFKDDLYVLLKQLDPTNADFWFSQVIPCESSYNPNTYYIDGEAGHTPDEFGAWGLYQMGSDITSPNPDGKGKNGEFDRGDVPWRKQTSNAIDYYYKVMGGDNMGAYWQCAR